MATLEQNGVDSQWSNETRSDFKNGKRYLKNEYQTHIGCDERCPVHCLSFSLSEPNEPCLSSRCDHEHYLECDRCLNGSNTLQQILDKVSDSDNTLSDTQRERIEFEVRHALESTHAWKAQLLRTINQERAKNDILSILDRESVMVVLDWAVEFLPLKFREQMTDFFGKKGKNRHVTCVIEKNEDGNMGVETLVHAHEVGLQLRPSASTCYL